METPAFSKAHVQRCREAWNHQSFSELFITFCQSCNFSDVLSRLQLEEIDGVQLALDVIRDREEAPLISRAWLLLQNFVLVHSVDDPAEMKPIDIFVERGGVELAAIEMSKPEARWTQTILTTLAWTSTNERAVPRVIASGVHKVGIAFVREQHPAFLDISMSFIRSASAARSSRATLRADGALDAFISYIPCNKSTEPLQMRRGFRAASVVARLAGNDETGTGPTILRNNPDLIRTTLNIFQQVLDAGPDGTVINMLVNPHFITMDLLIISTADVNKPLLVNAIPICISALRRRGELNSPMVADIVKMFLQLSFDATCKQELCKQVPELFDLLTKLVPTPQQLRASKAASVVSASTPAVFVEHDTETIMAAQMLRSALTAPTDKLQTNTREASGSFVQGIVRRMVNTGRSPSMDQQLEIEQQNNSSNAFQRASIIISYSWHSAELARKLDECLRSYGFRVWVDFRNIDNSPTDSLEHAMREAGAMVVLATSRYKESAVCRKEVELAEEKRVPLVFIQAEDGYKPDGWLSLAANVAAVAAGTRGCSQMLPGWTPALLKSSISTLIKRVGAVAPSCLPTKAHSNTSASNPKQQLQEAKEVIVQETDPRLVDAIMALTATVNDMRRELNELRMEVRGMKTN